LRTLAAVLFILTPLSAQTSAPLPQPMLDNDWVKVLRVAVPPGGKLDREETGDAVLLRMRGESAQFLPKGSRLESSNSSGQESVEYLIELKEHWDAPMRVCAYPMTCTRETKLGGEAVAWTTTLFTNGFITAATHKAARHASLTSSYYSAKGSDHIVLIPFTNLYVSFGGVEEILKAGQPYFTSGTQVEVSAKETDSRWFVLRLNTPTK
jgi:hypothetical protein